MKLVLAIINNDDSAAVAAKLTNAGYSITKLSTTGGFLQTGNTTLLIGAEDDQVEGIREVIRQNSITRKKDVPSSAAYGRGLGVSDPGAAIPVRGATVFVLSVDSFEKI